MMHFLEAQNSQELSIVELSVQNQLLVRRMEQLDKVQFGILVAGEKKGDYICNLNFYTYSKMFFNVILGRGGNIVLLLL